MAKLKLPLGEIALFGMLGALTFGAKVAMAGLPNIEPVSLMVMLFGAVFGLKALCPVYVYVLMEILLYGIGTWNLMYLYIWPLLAVLAYFMRRRRDSVDWALLSGAFGLAFGALCAPVDFLLGDLGYVVAKWTSGILFDVAHGVGNFVIALVLVEPLRTLVEKLYKKMQN